MIDPTFRQFFSAFEREYDAYVREFHHHQLLSLVGISLVVAGTVFFLGHLLTFFDEAEPKLSRGSGDRSSEIINEIVSDMLARSQKLRVEARQLITLIFFISITGITLFYFAGDLAYEERAAKSRVTGSIGRFQTNYESAQKGILETFDKTIKEVQFADDPSVKNALLSNAATTSTQLVQLAKEDVALQPLYVSINRNILISAGLARSGIVLIMGYLIRILLSSYKYDTRLAALYSARAYSLALTDIGSLPPLSELVRTLDAGDLDFEALPSEAHAAPKVPSVESSAKPKNE